MMSGWEVFLTEEMGKSFSRLHWVQVIRLITSKSKTVVRRRNSGGTRGAGGGGWSRLPEEALRQHICLLLAYSCQEQAGGPEVRQQAWWFLCTSLNDVLESMVFMPCPTQRSPKCLLKGFGQACGDGCCPAPQNPSPSHLPERPPHWHCGVSVAFAITFLWRIYFTFLLFLSTENLCFHLAIFLCLFSFSRIIILICIYIKH